MRVLLVSPRQGWPPLSGAKLREYHFCRALGRGSVLSYAYFAQSDQPSPQPSDLPFCRDIIGVPAPPPYTARRILEGLAGRWPLTVANYVSPRMTEAIHRLTAAQPFDYVQLDGIHLAAYADQVSSAPGAPRLVYNWHNIESEALVSHSRTMGPARRWYARLTAYRLARTEYWALRHAFGHIVCSERERLRLLEIAPQARVGVVDNGVETAYFAQPFPKHGRRLVFVGAMNYYPNIEAATSFATRVWPALHRESPDWHFSIVGASPPDSVRALGSIPGVEVTGTVPDVRPYYRDALAAVVPLRSGGGTRLKILEAMAAGVPVLSTPLGAEGLEITAGEHYLQVQDDAGWLPALSGLDEARRRQLSAAGLARVRARYDWDVLGQRLLGIYEGWLS